ncbi:MAG: ATP phosphoribosyltransferase regulatory subunit [Thermodesulfobacteriota bacterium]
MLTVNNISLPQGVKDILPDEAEIVGGAEEIILSTFKARGFNRIMTPLVEYTDVLALGMGPELRDRVFTFTEPATGRGVAITPDITPQIARVVATRMRDAPLPLKLCYNRGVLRLQESGGNAFREILQIGAEYLTDGQSPQVDVDANAEMITTAIEILKALGLTDFTIDIGNTGFVRAIIEGLPVDSEEKTAIREAIALKDISTLEGVLARLKGEIDEAMHDLILLIPTLFGDDRVVQEALSMVPNGETRESLTNLAAVTEALRKKGYGDNITVDLGEVRGFDYYTGIIFEAFAHGVGKAILSGGRYDTLMAQYGYPCSAIGFAFDVENLVTAMEQRG